LKIEETLEDKNRETEKRVQVERKRCEDLKEANKEYLEIVKEKET
jgi:hypothetical protein